jgi:hypothetical protein
VWFTIRYRPVLLSKQSAPCNGDQKLTFVYSEEEPGRRAAAKLLAKDEARRIAVNTAIRPLPSFVAKLRAGIF